MTPYYDLPVVDRLRFIFEGLRTFVGARGFHVFGYNGVLLCLFMNGMRRRAERFARLVAAIEAGTLRPLRKRAARPVVVPAAESENASPKPPRARLPGRFDWLRQRLLAALGQRYDGGSYNNYYQMYDALLQTPELRRLYDCAPDRMGRLLRPVCHTLGLKQPDFLRLPGKPRPKARPAPSASGHRERRRRAAIQEHRPKPPSTPQPPPPPPSVVDALTEHERILEARRQFRRAFMAKHGYFPLVRFRGEEL